MLIFNSISKNYDKSIKIILYYYLALSFSIKEGTTSNASPTTP